MTDGRERFKKAIVRNVNGVRQPVEMWYYPATNEAEEIDEYVDQEESDPELTEDDVTIIENTNTSVNAVRFDEKPLILDIPDDWKDEVQNTI